MSILPRRGPGDTSLVPIYRLNRRRQVHHPLQAAPAFRHLIRERLAPPAAVLGRGPFDVTCLNTPVVASSPSEFLDPVFSRPLITSSQHRSQTPSPPYHYGMALDLHFSTTPSTPAFARPYRRQRTTPTLYAKPYHLHLAPSSSSVSTSMGQRGQEGPHPSAVRLPSISSLLADTHDSDGSGPPPRPAQPPSAQQQQEQQQQQHLRTAEHDGGPSPSSRRSPTTPGSSLPSFRPPAPLSPTERRREDASSTLPSIRTLPLGPDSRRPPPPLSIPSIHHGQLPPPPQRSPAPPTIHSASATSLDGSQLQQARQECEQVSLDVVSGSAETLANLRRGSLAQLLDIFYHLRAENRARQLISQSGDAVPPPHLYEHGDYRAIAEYIDIELSAVSAREGPHVARQVAESYGLRFPAADLDVATRGTAAVHQRHLSSASSASSASASGHYQYLPPSVNAPVGHHPSSSWPPPMLSPGDRRSPLYDYGSHGHGHAPYGSATSAHKAPVSAAATAASRRSKAKRRVTKREGEVPACLGCGRLSTAEWRRGPTGPRTLCNACGLLFAKMTRLRKADGSDGEDPTLEELQAAVSSSSKGAAGGAAPTTTATSSTSTAGTRAGTPSSATSGVAAGRKRSSPSLPFTSNKLSIGGETSGEYSTGSRSYETSTSTSSARVTPPTSSSETSPIWSRAGNYSAEARGPSSPAPPYFPRRSTYPPRHYYDEERASASPQRHGGDSTFATGRPSTMGGRTTAAAAAAPLPGIASFGDHHDDEERFYPQPPPHRLPYYPRSSQPLLHPSARYSESQSARRSADGDGDAHMSPPAQ